MHAQVGERTDWARRGHEIVGPTTTDEASREGRSAMLLYTAPFSWLVGAPLRPCQKLVPTTAPTPPRLLCGSIFPRLISTSPFSRDLLRPVANMLALRTLTVADPKMVQNVPLMNSLAKSPR